MAATDSLAICSIVVVVVVVVVVVIVVVVVVVVVAVGVLVAVAVDVGVDGAIATISVRSPPTYTAAAKVRVYVQQSLLASAPEAAPEAAISAVHHQPLLQ